MAFLLSFLFIIYILISAFLQASDNSLKDKVSPGLTAFCGLLVLYGGAIGNVPFMQGIILCIALFLLASSDFVFEKSTNRAELFPIAIGFGVISGFIIGITFNVTAFSAGLSWPVFAGFALISVVASVLVYRMLWVDPPYKIPVYVYLLQAVILLTGGLASLYVGNVAFAVWGIFIFLSDVLVGIRAFPNKENPVRWLSEYRILFAIIVLYYSAQYALVFWAL